MSAASVPARAALAGNPSDGYGGAVLAVTIEPLAATVRLDGVAAADEPLLTAATLARFRREFRVDTSRCEASFSTTIPRSVGLGGSSAIVIATLSALCAKYEVTLAADAMAQLALSIEVDDLGIAAGLQDRLVQCHGGLVFMEFSGPEPQAERLEIGVLPPLLVAWRADHGEHSGVVHSDLRGRFERDEPGVREAMARLGALARAARVGLLAAAAPNTETGSMADPRRGLVDFRAAVDGSFDIRQELVALDPRHVELVTVGRSAGAAVNYTGSGGAVVCVCNDSGHRDAVARALQGIGAETVTVA